MRSKDAIDDRWRVELEMLRELTVDPSKIVAFQKYWQKIVDDQRSREVRAGMEKDAPLR